MVQGSGKPNGPKAAPVARPGRARRERPDLRGFDATYFRRPGVGLLAGIDEAGRGALAGPVAVGAVVAHAAFHVEGLDDSKRLTARAREALDQAVRRAARAVSVGWASALEVDRLNVLQATFLAARRAMEALGATPDLVVTDALQMEHPEGRPVEVLIKGDARSQVIAAASVVAKVARDARMRSLDAEYPDYGFASHKGYGAEAHLEALRLHGASTVHRHTFRGVVWFETEHRRSATLRGLLERLERNAVGAAEALRLWQGLEPPLPECEYEILRAAVEGRS